MSRHLQQDLEDSYHRLLVLSGQVEEMIVTSVRSLMERRRELAQQVIEGDRVDRAGHAQAGKVIDHHGRLREAVAHAVHGGQSVNCKPHIKTL